MNDANKFSLIDIVLFYESSSKTLLSHLIYMKMAAECKQKDFTCLLVCVDKLFVDFALIYIFHPPTIHPIDVGWGN